MKRDCGVCGKKNLSERGYKMHMDRKHPKPDNSALIESEVDPRYQTKIDPLAGMKEANPLDSLKAEAEVCAEKGRHELGGWKDEIGWASSECVFCKMPIAAALHPAQGTQRVSGWAAFNRCPKR